MAKISKLWTLFSILFIHNGYFHNCVQCDGEVKDFKSVPTTVKTFENDTVLLPCYLENAGTDYQVKWLKDKKVIVDSSDDDVMPPPRVRTYSNHSLQVSNVQPTDTGEYICEVVRAEPWSNIRQVHAIEVLYPPSVISIPEVGIVEVKIGDEVDIACKANGVPQPIITWISRGEPLELIDNRSRLKFKATNRNLAGHYECIANNGVGEPARSSIQVIIMHPPEVETDTQWIHTSIGLRSQLQCRVTASPSAKVHWFHGHNPVVLSSRIITHLKGDSHYLVFRTVRVQDLGVYTCKAENRIGMAEVRMHLSGVANIAVFKSDPLKNKPTQTSFTFIWQVDSYSPIIEYTLWFRPYKPKPTPADGVFIKEKDDTWMKLTIPGEHNDGPLHSASYVLHGLRPSTVYEALVVSRNKFGWSKPSQVLHFATISAATHEPKTTEETIHIPIIENVPDDGYSKNGTMIYSTPGEILDNLISSESSQNSGSLLSSSIKLLLIIMCVNLVVRM